MLILSVTLIIKRLLAHLVKSSEAFSMKTFTRATTNAFKTKNTAFQSHVQAYLYSLVLHSGKF